MDGSYILLIDKVFFRSYCFSMKRSPLHHCLQLLFIFFRYSLHPLSHFLLHLLLTFNPLLHSQPFHITIPYLLHFFPIFPSNYLQSPHPPSPPSPSIANIQCSIGSTSFPPSEADRTCERSTRPDGGEFAFRRRGE